jgi:hypothetical protein
MVSVVLKKKKQRRRRRRRSWLKIKLTSPSHQELINLANHAIIKKKEKRKRACLSGSSLEMVSMLHLAGNGPPCLLSI